MGYSKFRIAFLFFLLLWGSPFRPVKASAFLVLPLPYPIAYLEKIPSVEEEEIKQEAAVEEAPATEFRPLVPADFESQKAIGYTYGETFKVPLGLERQVDFWKLIYHRYSNQQYVIHDLDTMIIYRTVTIRDIDRQSISYRQKRRLINNRLKAHKRHVRALLRSVHEKRRHPEKLTPAEKKIYDLFIGWEDSQKFLRASRGSRIRAQLGQKENFKQGIIWAGRYLDRMENIFKDEDLPMELTRLPFVESSFNLRARSKVGASGIWQFMRSTGIRFLQINRTVDERNDPLEATRAAAKLLKLNFMSLQSWPLAVTAYNHGRAGMMRAVQKVGSQDLSKIIERYDGRTFGFASKNFYASFLAALQVELNYKSYFGAVEPEAPLNYDTVKLDHYIGIYTLTRHAKISKQLLKRYNPALTEYVFSDKKFIPRGYALKIPVGAKKDFLATYNQIPQQWMHERQKKSIYHRVRQGDTLSYLARRYRTTIQLIRDANRLGEFIYAGQTLVIPGR